MISPCSPMATSRATSKAYATAVSQCLSHSQRLQTRQHTYFPFNAHPRRLLRSAEALRCSWRAYSGKPSSPGSTSPSVSSEHKTSRFRQYAEQFKNKPASHLLSFGILHEITAVVPLPIVYFVLAETGIKIPFPEQAMEEGNKFVGRVAKYYGWSLEGADGARVMLNMATSYAVVKALLPVRLALCVWMTPWTATRIVSPVVNFWERLRR
ncbi:hypothetical protein BGZ72_008768 [Mortierella alpina]|nr:hypothetical protein BGZ72_008768 [Mortierella alpina]